MDNYSSLISFSGVFFGLGIGPSQISYNINPKKDNNKDYQKEKKFQKKSI